MISSMRVTITSLLFIAARAEEEGSGGISMEMTRDGGYVVTCNIETDWSVNTCKGFVEEYCEAFCEKKKPIYEDRAKANAKDATKKAKAAMKAEKNAKLAKDIRIEKDNKIRRQGTTTTMDPLIDTNYDPEKAVTKTKDDEKEDELSQLGGDAIKDPDTNEKTLAERQALLKDVDFWKPHHEKENEPDLSPFLDHEVEYTMIVDSSVDKEKSKELCDKVSSSPELTLKECTLAEERKKLYIIMIIEGKSKADKTCQSGEKTVKDVASDLGIPEPTKIRCQFALEGKLKGEDTNEEYDTNSTEVQTTIAPEAEDSNETTETTATDDKAKDETATDDKTKDETATDDKAKDETATDDKAKDETATDDKAKDETATDDKAKDETATDDKAKDETATDDKAKDETETDDKAKDETATDDKAKDETATDDKAKDETATDDKAKDETATDDKVETAAADETPKKDYEYKALEGTAQDEGNKLEDSKVKSLEEAKKTCDNKEGCESFGFCTNDGGTYLFDKKMDQDEPVKSEKDDCTTYYRSPKSNEKLNTKEKTFAERQALFKDIWDDSVAKMLETDEEFIANMAI